LTDPRHLKEVVRDQAKEHGRDLVVEVLSGTLATAALGLVGLVLVQIGVAQQSLKPGEKFALPELKLFQPSEFWKSLTGLIVDWSQANEWLLLGLGVTCLLVTVAVLIGWRYTRKQKDDDEKVHSILHDLAREKVLGLKTASSLAMLTGLLLGAYGYQQYLWRVALPVPAGHIGIAFTRELGSSIARNRLADDLKQLGHANELDMRELPVTFDATDIDKARALARRIGADAVVIYHDETVSAPAATAAGSRGQGLAVPLPDAVTVQHVAYVVFANPSIGVQVPIAERTASGQASSITYRAKQGVEVPRLQADDVSRVMEAAAGILLYDKDRYLPAIVHLQDALSGSGSPTPADAIVDLYLGHAYYVLGQDADATAAYQKAISLWEGEKPLPVQDRLLLAGAYAQEATLLFNQQKVDQAEALLQKAVALRAPLNNDQAALSDPSTSRRLRITYGDVYIALMDIALYRKDQDAANLWSSRAQDEAKALAAYADLDAQENAIWLQYSTGDCVGAAQQIYALIGQNPSDMQAHQLAQRLAYLRSKGRLPGDITEVVQQLNAVLQLNPTDLPSLESQQTYQALSAALEDPGYLPAEKQTADAILAVDPNNAQALQGYVSDAMDSIAWQFNAQPGGALWNAEFGDTRTFQIQQAGWQRDPAQIQAALTQYDALRPYLTRWAEELQPQSATPLLYKARLSRLSEFLLYDLQYVPGAIRLPVIADQYQALWQRAITDVDLVLKGGRQATLQEQVDTSVLLSELWNDQFWVRTAAKSPDAAAASQQALQQAQAAVTLVKTHPPVISDDFYSAANVYLNLFTSLTNAKVSASNSENTALVAQYANESSAALTQWLDLTKQYQATSAPNTDYSMLAVCKGVQSLRQSEQALQNGDAATAVASLTTYTTQFPHDPDGFAALGWAQYRNGDAATALTTTQHFEQMAPRSYLGPANQAIMLLALGRTPDAQKAYGSVLDILQGEPIATRLLHLSAMADDLLTLARDAVPARPGVKAVVPALAGYLAGLPTSARATQGSQLLYADSNLGGAAFWAGDYATASRLDAAALALNPTSIMVLTNIGLTKLASGDSVGAQADYDRAIAAAPAYLNGVDGQPLQGQDRQTALTQARQELTAAAAALQAVAKQMPALQPAADKLVQQLQGDAARLS